MYYRDERNGGIILPFLAGAIVGPLFFNGFGNNQYNTPYQYPQGQPLYQQVGPVYYPPYQIY